MTVLDFLDNKTQQTAKNLKPWLKAVFASEEMGLHLKAIDLELASTLCHNEIVAKEKLDGRHHSETEVKVYAYLVIKLSQALSRGEVCIEVAQLFDIQKKLSISLEQVTSYLPEFVTLHHMRLAAITQKDPHELVIDYPLVIMQGRLYFSRYWFYQQQVFFAVNHRLENTQDYSDNEELAGVLQQLFPEKYTPSSSLTTDQYSYQTPEPNWQMLAAANACLNRFSVITGGPGTGKTTTVTRLLAALISQQLNLRIALAAPTGKAAARLVESIVAAKTKLAETFPLAEKIPVTSFTLHRLLGWRPDGFSYNHNKTLPYDLVIVDEASMVDLPMMAQLMESLAEHTKLILLGDKDQLASVEAGSVLGDLCDSGVMVNGYHAHGLQAQRAQQLESLCGLEAGFLTAYIEPDAPLMANSLTQLRKSYRFTSDSGIGQLASAVNAGRYDLVEQSFTQYDDIQSYSVLYSVDRTESEEANAKQAEQAWQQQVVNGYGIYLNAIAKGESPEVVLELFNRFQLLCALRQGNSGLVALNERIQTLLQARGLLQLGFDAAPSGYQAGQQLGQRWYSGRPVMITRNDYGLNLFNGDIGIAMMVPVLSSRVKSAAAERELRVCFMTDGKVRQILPTRLPEHETAFAMTVHKSQGSEFTDVALVLPESHSPVISRELIYTAITRAKSRFSLYSNREVLERGVGSKIERASGLRDLLF